MRCVMSVSVCMVTIGIRPLVDVDDDMFNVTINEYECMNK